MIQFIDASCMLGQRLVLREGSLKDTREIVDFMDYCGVTKAIAFHCVSKENSPELGNPLLDEAIGGDKHFIKQWVVMPSIWGEFMSPDQLLVEMKKNNVTSVRMYPTMHGYSMAPYSAGPLINALAEHKVPIFIEMGQLGTWENVYNLCKNYPQARFILLTPGYRCVRWLAPILDACDNLWVDTSDLLMHTGIKEFCKYHGAQRLIFSSNVPNGSMAAAVSQIRYSDISDQEKQMIASENILKLLEEVTL